MADDSEFDNCRVITSNVKRDANSYKAVWVLEDIGNVQTSGTLCNVARLHFEIKTGEGFFHVEFRATKGSYGITIKAKPTQLVPQSPVSFDVRVQSLRDSTPTIKVEKTLHFSRLLEETVVTEINLSTATTCNIMQHTTFGRSRNHVVAATYSGGSASNAIDLSPSYCLGFVLTPIPGNWAEAANFYRVIHSNTESKLPNITQTSLRSVFRDFGKFYLEGQDNYSDLKLEGRDGVLINAHKFVLAARSCVFQEMIEMSMKQNAFDGTIKITDVNAKPLMALLHWVYAGELQEGTENYMQELIDAAVKFELPELMDALDNKFIKICNTDNMLDLLKLAKQNKMETAVMQISKFIKENL